MSNPTKTNSNWNTIYQLGAWAAIGRDSYTRTTEWLAEITSKSCRNTLENMAADSGPAIGLVPYKLDCWPFLQPGNAESRRTFILIF